jgi:NADPH2:quinone reductase
MIASSPMRTVLVREFGDPDVLRVEEVPDPKPGPSEILVRIRAAGINPVETYIRSGVYARKPNLPWVPGTDGAGEVEAVGTHVKNWKPGDRVYIAGDNVSTTGTGTYAEKAICSPGQLHRLPDRVTFAQGAALGVPYATAYRSLFLRASARPGETVLVHGASGGVGIGAVEMAKAHGMTVIGTAGTERGLQVVREHGADIVLNHREPNYLEAVMPATEGRGANIILEMAAHINLDKDLTVLGHGGRIVIIGSRGRVEIDPRGAMGRDAAIMGMLLFNTSPAELASVHAAIVAGLANGTLNPLVNREIPLAEAPRAHVAVHEPGALGKIVLVT